MKADVNAQGGEYGNALQAASCHGYEAIVKLLLENMKMHSRRCFLKVMRQPREENMAVHSRQHLLKVMRQL